MKNLGIAVFVDLDSTITIDEDIYKVSNETIDALKQLQDNGFYVVIATGRNLEDTIKVWNQIYKNEFCDYLINSNGALISKNENGSFIEVDSHSLSKKDYETLIEYGKKNKYVIKTSLERTLFSDNFLFRSFAKLYDSSFNFKKYKDLIIENDDNQKYNKVGYFFYKKSDSDKAYNLFLKDFNRNFEAITSAQGRFLEITNKGVSKGSAAIILAEKLNIDLSRSYAFGDSLNDYSLFETVGYGIAMENSMPKLFEYAYDKTKSVEEDGVAFYVKNNILTKKYT